MIGRCLGIELRSYNGEGLRHRGDCAIKHFLPGFFHLSKTEKMYETGNKDQLLMCNIKKVQNKL